MHTTTSVPVLSLQDLVQLSQEHQEHIDEIKNEIAQEIDNLNNPKPLFDSLSDQ